MDYCIDPQILKFNTIKLIIQPFIENALEHAWVGDRIYIRVVGERKDEHILLQIIDDGVGMTQTYASQLLQSRDDRQKGYGILNVHRRIQLSFGDEYGVSIYSRPGIGTNISITIPIQEKNVI